MRTYGAMIATSLAAAALGLAGCDGSADPHPSTSTPAPVAIEPCAASVRVPSETTQAVPNASLPPTAVIRTGGALSIDVPDGSTLGLGAPLGAGAAASVCRAAGPAVGTAVVVGRQPGFVRLVLATAAGAQRVVNVQVTV